MPPVDPIILACLAIAVIICATWACRRKRDDAAVDMFVVRTNNDDTFSRKWTAADCPDDGPNRECKPTPKP